MGKIKITNKLYSEFKTIDVEIFDSTFVYIDKLLKFKTTNKKFIDILNIFRKYVLISDKFIEKYDVKEYHIKLIRNMYFNDDYSNMSNDYFINLELKRPYGSSSPYVDIATMYCMYIYPDMIYDDMYEFTDKNLELLKKIHIKTMNIFINLIKECDLKYFEYESKYGINWEPTERAIQLHYRKRKILNLL